MLRGFRVALLLVLGQEFHFVRGGEVTENINEPVPVHTSKYQVHYCARDEAVLQLQHHKRMVHFTHITK